MQLARSLSGQRGQALIESVVFLPLFLLVLFGIIWIVQISVLSERAQIAVRYSGLISNESSPYTAYSIYAVYNNIGTLTQVEPATCATPSSDAFLNNNSTGAFPGPQAAPFWWPDSGTSSGACTSGTAPITGGSLGAPLLLTHTTASVAATKAIPLFIQGAIGPFSTLSAAQNFVNTPDIATTFKCYPDLQAAVSASLVGEKAASGGSITLPLPDFNPSNPLPLSGTC